MKIISFLAVFAGGGLGSVLRYLISRGVVAVGYKFNFPLATLLANVLACLAMAVVLSFSLRDTSLSHSSNLFWLVGFCGGFSTFSTFSYENWLLLKDGFYGMLVLNVLVSVVLCMAVFIVLARYLSASGV